MEKRIRNLVVMVKPASGTCNMRCEYCFYADEQHNREQALHGMMSVETLHALIDRVLEAGARNCTLVFQGGEPTLVGLPFYRDLAAYVGQKTAGKRIRFQYSIQTNGYAMTEEWAAFLAENQFLVGISLDGTKEIHDRFRKDSQGKGTWDRVMRAIGLLNQYHVSYNILTVVTAANAKNAAKLYRFFEKQGLPYQQYIECLDPLGEIPGQKEYSLTPERYEYFLKSLFDVWYQDRKQGKYVYNRYFENLLLMLNGQEPESCNMRGVCSSQWVVEADGSVYPCDFYALDEWKLGMIATGGDSFAEMEQRRQESGFLEASRQIPNACRTCRWFGLCRNGCRRCRVVDVSENPGINYFCQAYKGFFEYAYPRLEQLASTR